ncbi:TPA: hypothetical protein ACM87P_005286, partial [Escherichia coli O103:H2]
PNSYMGFVNTLDAPASDVLRTLHLYAGWFVDWPAVDGGDEDDDDDEEGFSDETVNQLLY